MPYRNTPPNKNFFGWYRDMVNNKLELYDGAGVKVAEAAAAAFGVTGALSTSTTLTGGTGVIATAGDVDVTAGNFRAGVKSAFASTEPTSALVMKAGTAGAGAITTSGGIWSTATVLQKIIAAGTVSSIET